MRIALIWRIDLATRRSRRSGVGGQGRSQCLLSSVVTSSRVVVTTIRAAWIIRGGYPLRDDLRPRCSALIRRVGARSLGRVALASRRGCSGDGRSSRGRTGGPRGADCGRCRHRRAPGHAGAASLLARRHPRRREVPAEPARHLERQARHLLARVLWDRAHYRSLQDHGARTRLCLRRERRGMEPDHDCDPTRRHLLRVTPAPPRADALRQAGVEDAVRQRRVAHRDGGRLKRRAPHEVDDRELSGFVRRRPGRLWIQLAGEPMGLDCHGAPQLRRDRAPHRRPHRRARGRSRLGPGAHSAHRAVDGGATQESPAHPYDSGHPDGRIRL